MAQPDTQHKSKSPLSEASGKATGSVQWTLESRKDEQTPVFRYNNLQIHICGEESFKAIARDIRTAEQSIDIAFWGFDPAMELERDGDTWPRGVTWGDLLRDAAQGKLGSGKKVTVRLLVWWDTVAAAFAGSNMPGYRRGAPFELKAASGEGMGRALVPEHLRSAPPRPITPQDRREVFNSQWYRDVVAGKIDGLSLRTRGGVHADVVASLQKEGRERQALAGVGGTERLGLELMATHHQKTIVIDYEGANPRAYVMGLNAVTDYWDTAEHRFTDRRRGEPFEGGGKDHSASDGWKDEAPDKTSLKPYRDYVCSIQGEAVAAVCKNFTEAWNRAKPDGKGGGSNLERRIDLKKLPQNLTARLAPSVQSAQILRTMPQEEGSEHSIARLYYQASSFARHYLYIENQYFQNTDWAHALMEKRRRYVEQLGQCASPIPLAEIPVLHVMIVTSTPERGQMIPRTHDVLAELGHGDSMPNQDKMINLEIERHDRAVKALAAFQAQRRACEAGKLDIPGGPVYPGHVPELSDIARSHQEAGATKDSQAAREELRDTLGLRSLVVSLWTYDKEWSLADTPASRKAAAEQRHYEQEKKVWDRYQQGRKEARARDIAGDGWGRSMEPRLPPVPPPDRSRQIRDETAHRYREIYIHSKLMLIDDSMFTLGSANLNLRSFAVDSEMNIASDDAVKARDLRKRVWAQLTDGQFAGGDDVVEPKVMRKTFKNWEDEAKSNFINKKLGFSLTSFLVKFYEERTSRFRLG